MPQKFIFCPVAGCDDEEGLLAHQCNDVVDVLVPLHLGALRIQAYRVVGALVEEHVVLPIAQRESRFRRIGQNITYFELDLSRRVIVFGGDLPGELDGAGTVVNAGDVRESLAQEVEAGHAVAAPEVEDGRVEGHQVAVPVEPRQHAVERVLAEPNLALVLRVVGEVGQLTFVGVVPT